MAKKYPQLIINGFDISRDMLEHALKNRAASRLNPRVQFQEASVQQMPFAPNSMDFAVSTLSLHHWPDPEQALREIYRVLKPGGQLLIFDLRRDTPRIFFYIFRFGQRFLAPPPIRRTNGAVGSIWSTFTVKEMKTFLSKSPFRYWKVQSGWGWAYIWGQK